MEFPLYVKKIKFINNMYRSIPIFICIIDAIIIILMITIYTSHLHNNITFSSKLNPSSTKQTIKLLIGEWNMMIR